MSKLILFSQPTPTVLDTISSTLFYKPRTTVAFMPSDGSNPKNPKYIDFWAEYIKKHNGEIVVIDNSRRGKDAQAEIAKLRKADALVLSGGNTFVFLYHLRESGLSDAVKDFVAEGKVLAGFSAGAILMSPTIDIVNLPPDEDENLPGLTDLTALDLIKFDIYPHYERDRHEKEIARYEQKTGREVRRLTDEDVIITEVNLLREDKEHRKELKK